ncbi:MAG: hypothetical protein K2G85_08085 [Muribaculaceae bacterium]|nr:hypothetical protein [Muribaculaceae bacterium]
MVTKMIDKALEIEGLLRIIRDGDPSPEALDLLCAKTEELFKESLTLKDEKGVSASLERHKEKPNEKPEETNEETLSNKYQEEDDILLSFDIEEEPAVQAEIEMTEIQAQIEDFNTQSDRKPNKNVKLKSAFTLNDRFLYSRELFDGNMKMFDSTLEFLEGIEDYSIIEDYFYSELEWDPENIHVATFMDILRPYFRE